MGSETPQKPHVVCVPLAAQGHVMPMLNVAKLLYCKGLHVTFVHSKNSCDRLIKALGSNCLDGLPSFRFVAVEDGVRPEDCQDAGPVFQSILSDWANPFKELLLKLNNDSPPVTFMLADVYMPFVVDVGKEVGLPVVSFCPSGACGLWGFAQYQTLLDKGIVPFKDACFTTDGTLDEVIDWIPGMEGIPLKYLPSFMRTTDEEDILFRFCKVSAAKALEDPTRPIILNTYDALEHDVLEAISTVAGPVFPIGPLQLQLDQIIQEHQDIVSLDTNLWKKDTHCLEWLDLQKPNSVMYVNFGSTTTMTVDQLIEFGWGLANSEQPFLWIIRDNLVTGDSLIISEEFIAKTKGRSLLADWCDQGKVLKHPSICAFLTHNGWNSTMESIIAGVPMLCWPFFAEQQTNCWFCCHKWGNGMEITSNVTRDEVEKQVCELANGEKGKEMKKNALRWKKLAEEATASPNGSSFVNLNKFIDEIIHS